MLLYLNNTLDNIKKYMDRTRTGPDPIKDRKNKKIFYNNNKKSGIYMFTYKINNKKIYR